MLSEFVALVLSKLKPSTVEFLTVNGLTAEVIVRQIHHNETPATPLPVTPEIVNDFQRAIDEAVKELREAPVTPRHYTGVIDTANMESFVPPQPVTVEPDDERYRQFMESGRAQFADTGATMTEYVNDGFYFVLAENNGNKVVVFSGDREDREFLFYNLAFFLGRGVVQSIAHVIHNLDESVHFIGFAYSVGVPAVATRNFIKTRTRSRGERLN